MPDLFQVGRRTGQPKLGLVFMFILCYSIDGVEMVQVIPLRRTLVSSNPNALVAVSKGTWAVKLCSDKVLQFLTGGRG